MPLISALSALSGGLVLTLLLTGCTSGASYSRPHENSSRTSTAQPPDRVLSQQEWDEQAKRDHDSRVQVLRGTVPGADPKAVQPSRFVSLDEWPQAMATCLTAAGHPAEADSSGALVTSGQDPDDPESAQAQYDCGEQFPVSPVFTISLNKAQLRYLYAYYVGPLSACLARNGYAPTEEAPPLAKFEHDYYTSNGWTPYASIPEDGPLDFDVLTAKCEQTPSDIYPKAPPHVAG
jgi:hypothetical protein